MRSVMDFTHSIPSVSPRIGRRRLVDPRCTLTSTAMRPQSSVFTAVTVYMKRWINVQSPDRNRRLHVDPSLHVPRSRCEYGRLRSHRRTGQSTSWVHQAPPPNTRRDARYAVGEIHD